MANNPEDASDAPQFIAGWHGWGCGIRDLCSGLKNTSKNRKRYYT